MFVVGADRLDKYDGRQLAAGEVTEEIGFVSEVLRLRGRPISVPSKECKRLMVKLKERVRMAGQRIPPSPGIPGPGDALIAQPVADRWEGLMWDQRPRFDICRVGVVHGERGVDHVAVRSHPAVPHQKSIRIELGPKLGGASAQTGVHAHTNQKWFKNDPPKAAWKKLSASVNCWARRP